MNVVTLHKRQFEWLNMPPYNQTSNASISLFPCLVQCVVMNSFLTDHSSFSPLRLVLLLKHCLRQWSTTLNCNSAVAEPSLTSYICILRHTWSSLRFSIRNSLPQGDAFESVHTVCVHACYNPLWPHKAIKHKC